ncbi:MAG: TetR/AcrR family transcriptional regulator [Eubacterium sp.]|jgi:probable dihydroxyacetone kinase regulator
MAQLTQQAMRASLKKLLNERPLDKITVKDIVEDCGVNRNTFYYHYSDIYELLDDVFRTEMKEYEESAEDPKTWTEALISMQKFARENKQLVYHVFNSINREMLQNYMYGIADTAITKLIDNLAEGADIPEKDKHYIVVISKHAAVGLILDWVQNGMKEDAEDFLNRMGEVLDDMIKAAIKIASEKQ